MTLDQLRYFVAAAKFEHINRAAHSIPISASAISNAVKELEEEYSCALFVREKQRIRLTSDGSRLLELATNLLAQAEGLKQKLTLKDLPLAGHYRIGASHILATKILSPAWTQLQAKYPDLTADVHAQPTWSLIDHIISGRIDFGLGFSPTPHPQLESEELYRGHSVAVVRKDHPLFSRVKSNHYKLLREYPATMHIADERINASRPHPVLRAAGLDSPISFSFDSEFVALENLRNSDNWSFMLDISAKEFGKYLRTIPIPRQSEAQFTIHFIRHRSKRLDPVMNESLKLFKNHVTRLWGKKA